MGTCYDYYRNEYYRCNTAWNTWGRWVLFGVIVVGFLLFFFLFSCLTARRRRKRGLQPFYGTGWAGSTPGHGATTYNPQYQNQQSQPQYGGGDSQGPGYGQQGGYYGQTQGGGNQGYYGGQPTEMQAPPNTYRGGDQVYSPPTGPPPGKQ